MPNNKLEFQMGVDTSKYEAGLKKAESVQRRFASKTAKDLKLLQKDYKNLTIAEVKTRGALKSLEMQGKKNTAEYKAQAKALQKINQRLLKKKDEILKTADALKKNEIAQKNVAKATQKTTLAKQKQQGVLSQLKSSYLAIAAAVASVILAFRRVGQLVLQSTDAFLTYETALQEVNTLFSGAGGLTDATKEFIRQQSLLFGRTQQENLKAYYQIVSAGITDQLEANKVLEQANKAAIAGVTGLFTAVDGLTSALNAYKEENLTAKEAADSMFSAVKLGKTTFGELAGSMGQVLTLAQSVGISFQEVMASAAQLTLRGLSTAESFTQLKGVIRTFLKPSAEAIDAMDEMGIQLDANEIRSKGFVQVMKEVSEAVGGNEKKLALLFGRIQGLTGAQALSSKGAKALAGFVAEVGNSAGATDTALAKMSDTLKLRLERAQQGWNDKMIQSGKLLQSLRVRASEVKNAFGSLWLSLSKGIHFMTESDNKMAKLTRNIAKYTIGLPFVGYGLLHGGDDKKEATETGGGEATKTKPDKSRAGSPKKTAGKSAITEVKDTLKLTIKAGEDAIKSLYDTAIDKAQEGITRIREATEKAIYQLRALYFGGGGFQSLGKAFQSLQGNDEARSAFTSFTGRVDQKSLSPSGISSLAGASVEFAKLDSEGKSAVNSIIEKIKELKGLVEATDIVGAVQAGGQGFKTSGFGGKLLNIARGSFKVNERDLRQKGEQKEQELIAQTLKELAPKMKDAVDDFKDSSKEVKEAVQSFKESVTRDFPLVLENFRSELTSERQQQKAIQNGTSSLSPSSVQGGI